MLIENKRESILYVAATFSITWLCWGLLALLGIPAKQNVVSVILYLLGGFSTLIVALILPLFAKKEERSAHYRRFFNFRISKKWYIVPIVCILFVVYLPYCFMLLFYGKTAIGLNLKPFYLILPLFVSMIIGGGVEEFGWRGILVHNLRKMNPLLVSIVVGLIWACWHIPLFFIKGVSQYHADFLPFLITVIAYSLITTILYLNSGSVIPCVIAHALLNAFSELGFWYAGNQVAVYTDSIIRLVVAFVLFMILSKEKAVV